MYIPNLICSLTLGQIQQKLDDLKEALGKKNYPVSDAIRDELMSLAPTGRLLFNWNLDHQPGYKIPNEITLGLCTRIENKPPLQIEYLKDGNVRFVGEIIQSVDERGFHTTTFDYTTRQATHSQGV